MNIEDEKRFDVNEFEIYVFNICEKYAPTVDPVERFCKCPDNFFDVAKQDSIRKIEEVYFLIHKTKDLVIYLTTNSHKYISKKQRGFLNDRTKYEDKINLNQIEFAYVGRIIRNENRIDFEHPGKKKGMKLQYSSTDYPNKLLIKSGHIATAENDYSITSPIQMDNVFYTELSYNNSTCDIVYFRKEEQLNVNTISFSKKKEKLNLIFRFQNNSETMYKMGTNRLRFRSSFEDID